ncbi:MerR family transcriptional regulator [Sporomusa malonica]|uniref:Transcriptional regulator, MerR family n=1 Tax=Sporomusa malonica TaxID=112901 RepID=A0A1W1ZAK2_9FIRM|nr:MerR family transcriptional regulator [Sporomusa malonica]SMC45470.1 transcriptional regulator, MerR family [Sporomusa malonica]
MVISEVSEKYGMTQDALRYYERVGLIPPVPRKPNGIRDYDDYSCGWIEFIHCMRNAGIPVEVLVEYVQLYQQGSKTKEARKELLQEELKRLNDRIANLQATRERLACKIENYDDLEKS